jgi:hypothetical protein
MQKKSGVKVDHPAFDWLTALHHKGLIGRKSQQRRRINLVFVKICGQVGTTILNQDQTKKAQALNGLKTGRILKREDPKSQISILRIDHGVVGGVHVTLQF